MSISEENAIRVVNEIYTEWFELLLQEPHSTLFAIKGFLPIKHFTLSQVDLKSNDYYNYFNKLSENKPLEYILKKEIDFFKWGKQYLSISINEPIFSKEPISKVKVSTRIIKHGVEREIPQYQNVIFDWIDFYNKICKRDFDFSPFIQEDEILAYIIGRVKFAKSLFENQTQNAGTEKFTFCAIVTQEGNKLTKCSELIEWLESKIKEFKELKPNYNELALYHREKKEFIKLIDENLPSTTEEELFVDECRDYLLYLQEKINALSAQSTKTKTELPNQEIQPILENNFRSDILPQDITAKKIETDKNFFCNTMPLNIPKEHFRVFIDKKSNNNQPFLNAAQFEEFIQRAFCNKKELPKQKFNQIPKGEKLLLQAVFYQFYEKYCFEYFQTMQCQDIFIKLLTENFEGWDFENVKNNFTPKTSKRL